jgi:hypothetical protein
MAVPVELRAAPFSVTVHDPPLPPLPVKVTGPPAKLRLETVVLLPSLVNEVTAVGIVSVELVSVPPWSGFDPEA